MTTSCKPISKILVAIDGSEKSIEASQYAVTVAKKYKATVKEKGTIRSDSKLKKIG